MLAWELNDCSVNKLILNGEELVTEFHLKSYLVKLFFTVKHDAPVCQQLL